MVRLRFFCERIVPGRKTRRLQEAFQVHEPFNESLMKETVPGDWLHGTYELQVLPRKSCYYEKHGCMPGRLAGTSMIQVLQVAPRAPWDSARNHSSGKDQPK